MENKTQIVYRFLTPTELDAWLKNQKEKIFVPYKSDRFAQSNNHKYKDGVKYTHFFKDITDAEFVLNTLNDDVNILCKFELSTDLLKKYESEGFYYDPDYPCRIDVTEYAIPLDLVDAKCLMEYKIIRNLNEARNLNANSKGWQKPQVNEKEMEM